MVEPLAGLLGVLAVTMAQSILPYALSFAAGAMIYVVFENIMPEASSHGNTKLATWCCIIGFCIMMSLDVGLNWIIISNILLFQCCEIVMSEFY